MTPFVMTTAAVLGLAIQFVLPLVVGVVTKASWPSGLKAVLLLAFSAVTEFLVAWQAAEQAHLSFDFRAYLYALLIGFMMSVAGHFGLWKPTGLAATAQRMLVNDGLSDDIPPRR